MKEKTETFDEKDSLLELIVREKRINDIRFLNKYFEQVNKTLKNGGIFKGNVETYQVRNNRLLKKFPTPINIIYLFFDTLLVRISPKLLILEYLIGKPNTASLTPVPLP